MVAKLTHQVEELKQENRELENDSDQKWFMIGAGVTLVSLFIGLIIPNIRWRKKDSWSSGGF